MKHLNWSTLSDNEAVTQSSSKHDLITGMDVSHISPPVIMI